MPSPPPSLDLIFCEAIEIGSPEARAAYITEACGGDETLRRQVESLVEAHFRAGSFLDRPVAAAGPTAGWAGAEAPGTLIGPYKLLEQIGEGGMGVVFVAEQQEPVRRRVALKVIKPGMDTREVVARFEAERQALALMDHPNIARVFDAGATQQGRPYFVMELVRGLPITDYCDRAGFPPRDRLRLFAQVCRAVQHAHMKGVIHRDLKPSNVLVTLHDGTPVPKVIDFGVAKAVGQRLTDRTLYTRFVQLVGTPLYMAPEQAELSGLDIDTRADVYALGVLLYELLTGTTPFDADTLRTAGLDEVRRIIREQEPPRPSQRLSTLSAEERSGASGRRGLDERQLTQLLRGDLDWVAMKALEKDRDRRYESAAAFAADVERYLADEPVEARPASPWYQARRFARRNRAVLLTAGLVAAALVSGTAVSVWQAVRATDAQHRAEAAEERATSEAAITSAVNDFLQRDLLGQAAGTPLPGQEFGRGPYLTVKEALDRAAARIGQRFQDQPLVEAAIRTTIGAAYNGLFEYQSAVLHLERAVALRKAHLGPAHQETLDSMKFLAETCRQVGRHQDAIALCQHVLEEWTSRVGPDHPVTLMREFDVAKAYASAGELHTSGRRLEQLLEKQRAVVGPTHADTLVIMHLLAMNYQDEERLTDAMSLLEKVLECRRSIDGADRNETTIGCMVTLAQVYQQAGRLDQSERLLREALEHCRKRDIDPRGRTQTANTLGWLARALLLQRRFDEAEPLAREAVTIFAEYQPRAVLRFYWMSLLGDLLLGQNKYDEAEPFILSGYEGTKQLEQVFPRRGRLRVIETGERVVRFYEVTGQPDKAKAWRAQLTPAKK